MSGLSLDRDVDPDDVKNPSEMREFLTLLDKQVASAIATVKDDDAAAVILAASLRARGLHWLLTRVVECLDRLDDRIHELEKTAVGDGK